MALTSSALQDRRRFSRVEPPPRLAVDVVQSDHRLSVDTVNVSEAGFCLRLRERLEVRSLVNLQVTPRDGGTSGARPVRCEGRVAWVIQRLDLRDAPPYLFDVGIEFADPPAFLRRLAARSAGRPAAALQPPRTVVPASAVIHGREYVPRLERSPGPRPGWHLIIAVDGVPCLSERHGSERAAKAAWDAFRRRQSRRTVAASS